MASHGHCGTRFLICNFNFECDWPGYTLQIYASLIWSNAAFHASFPKSVWIVQNETKGGDFYIFRMKKIFETLFLLFTIWTEPHALRSIAQRNTWKMEPLAVTQRVVAPYHFSVSCPMAQAVQCSFFVLALVRWTWMVRGRGQCRLAEVTACNLYLHQIGVVQSVGINTNVFPLCNHVIAFIPSIQTQRILDFFNISFGHPLQTNHTWLCLEQSFICWT